MASLRGLAYYAIANNLAGHPLIVNVGGVNRCMVAEMAPNVLATAAGEGPVPQLRFVCDGYCGLYAKRPSKQCRQVDRQALEAARGQVQRPPGLVDVRQNALPTPYHSGRVGGGATLQLPGRVGGFGIQSLLP